MEKAGEHGKALRHAPPYRPPPITSKAPCTLQPLMPLQEKGRKGTPPDICPGHPFLWAAYGGKDKQRNWPCL